jgi:ankyrin repeat protein
VLVKLPESVQQCLATKLEEIAEMDGDLNRRALALFNLSYAYVDGIGVKMDLVRAKFLLLKSANAGLHTAQDAYVSLFLHSTVDNETGPKDRSRECLSWIRAAAQRGNKRALALLRSQVPLVAQDAHKSWCLNQTFAVPAPRGHEFEDLRMEERSDVLDWIQWRSSFLRFAAQNNLLGMAKLIAEVDNSVLDQTDDEGQTALLLACRAGNTPVSRFLIMEGASTSKGDVKRVTPLHWLSSFEGDDKALMANMLAEKEVDPNAWAVGGHDNSTRPGTPLHWAVEQNDIVVAQLLVQIGSDPLCRSSEDDTWNPFQLACSLAHSCIVRYFLQLPAVATFASQHNAWGRSALMINPLFCALGGGSRWDRLVRHGERFEIETKDTLQSLVEKGADPSCVLRDGELQMAAPFAVAYHDCNHDLMSSGLECGFKPFVECNFGRAGSGATPLFMAITDRHYEMVKILLENGANIHARDAFNMTPLHRAAKETDNIDYVKILLEKEAMLDDPVPVTPFWIAVYSGNLRIAKYLYDLGADRDFTNPETHRTALGELIWMRTRNAARRVKFLLALPDRNSSDGSVVFKMDQHREIDALHLAVAAFSEDPDVAEVTRLMVTYLLEKYSGEEYLNSTKGAHRATCLASAVEEGNFKVARLLLAARLDPNIPDEYGRTPLDHLLWRYCYPASLDIFQTVDTTNQFQVSQLLSFVNRNTSELYSLLLSYNAKSRVFKFPAWYQDHPGYRNLDWVMEQLKEKREASPVQRSTPYWGGLQITIPERPMQTYGPTSETVVNTDGADATSAAAE